MCAKYCLVSSTPPFLFFKIMKKPLGKMYDLIKKNPHRQSDSNCTNSNPSSPSSPPRSSFTKPPKKESQRTRIPNKQQKANNGL